MKYTVELLTKLLSQYEPEREVVILFESEETKDFSVVGDTGVVYLIAIK